MAFLGYFYQPLRLGFGIEGGLTFVDDVDCGHKHDHVEIFIHLHNSFEDEVLFRSKFDHLVLGQNRLFFSSFLIELLRLAEIAEVISG